MAWLMNPGVVETASASALAVHTPGSAARIRSALRPRSVRLLMDSLTRALWLQLRAVDRPE
jgi:hypothetical protein